MIPRPARFANRAGLYVSTEQSFHLSNRVGVQVGFAATEGTVDLRATGAANQFQGVLRPDAAAGENLDAAASGANQGRDLIRSIDRGCGAATGQYPAVSHLDERFQGGDSIRDF